MKNLLYILDKAPNKTFLLCQYIFWGAVIWGTMMLIDYFVWDIHFPQLWQSSVFSALCVAISIKILGVQTEGFKSLKPRWQSEHRMQVFVPCIKTMLILIFGWPLFYLFLTARTTQLKELSYQAVRQEFISEQIFLNLQIIYLLFLLIYVLYLILFVRRNVN